MNGAGAGGRLRWRVPAGAFLIGGVTLVNLAGAGLAFAKDLAFAAYFGTTRAADLVNTAYLLPETIGYNLIAAVVSVAAVPALSRLWAQGRYPEFAKAARRLTVQTSAALAAVALALWAGGEAVFRLLGHGAGNGSDYPAWAVLYRLMLAALPVFPIFAAYAAALAAAGSFFAAAAAPLLLNATMLAAVIGCALLQVDRTFGAIVYAGAILAGVVGMAGLLRLRYARLMLNAAQIRPDRPSRGSISAGLATQPPGRESARADRPRPPIEASASASAPLPEQVWAPPAMIRSEGLRAVYAGMAPLLALTLCMQASYAFERAVAANLAPGTVTAVGYAYRVAQFPNWVFVAAVTAVLLPSLSRKADGAGLRGQAGEVARMEALRAARGTLALLLPAAALLFALRGFAVELLFGRGAFGADSVRMTSDLLAGYSLSVVGQAVSAIGLRYFLAIGRLRGCAAIYAVSTAFTMAFDLLLVPRYGAPALGYGACAGWTLNALLIGWLLMRKSRPYA
ncbi:lipid II flippase MurJ [Paenibacillus methanolicus]|uniref:Peptidoglycan biosynthesis protein MviN/MurJ (Putative lipid II flippase) n=1 Tax=Paenibacillus methanolicus TaxID=582686 RepID=A0A5S5BSV7_9BACL|nr:lipid II flippase MurJ [Paenibacillus methanolicus]TYP70097.1 peptidoglycan biosynthesis protein MviN/MurJ (putative lipid II flippase) [Paenibacillus methanolicus]